MTMKTIIENIFILIYFIFILLACSVVGIIGGVVILGVVALALLDSFIEWISKK